MKTQTETLLSTSKVALCICILVICIAFFYVFGIIIWGYFDSSILQKGTWNYDFYKIRNYSVVKYFISSIMILTPLTFYCLIFINLTLIISKFDMLNPFTMVTANRMTKISYYLVGIFLMGYINMYYFSALIANIDYEKTKIYRIEYYYNLETFFTLMVGLITYIFSLIYKRGIEIQSENDLTV